VLVFVALLAQAFFRQGIAAWSVGIIYILYDTALLAFTASQIRVLGKFPAPVTSTGPHARVCVIVAAHNEASVLAITIDTLAAQDNPPDMILLADDGSSDDSAAVLRSVYALEPPAVGEMSLASPRLPALHWLRLPHGGKARALNQALLHTDADIVITVDADTLLAPGALSAMRAAFENEAHLVAATGVLTPVCGPHVMGKTFQWFQSYEYVRNFLSRYAWMKFDSLLLISGAFAAFRRDAIMAVGGFDPDCMVEDYELIHRLHRYSVDRHLDWKVRVVGRAMAVTDGPATPMGFLRQRRRWFGGFLQTQHWNRDMIANRRFGWLGTAMLPVKTLDTLQPVYGLAAFFLLIGFLISGRTMLALPILIIMVAKIIVDLAFHLWSLHIYKRWTGQAKGLSLGAAIIASILEPFSFQLLRHTGALWGWIAFLTGRETWVKQRRTAVDKADFVHDAMGHRPARD
jgi:cellulose synthase/poly-beta-1,6-N-acetylglucosamine synthase-like glycosyltransferase